MKLERDKKSGAVLSVDGNSLDKYKKTKQVLNSRNNHIQELEQRLQQQEKILERITQKLGI